MQEEEQNKQGHTAKISIHTYPNRYEVSDTIEYLYKLQL